MVGEEADMVRFHSLVNFCAPLFICLFPVILVRPGVEMVTGSTMLTVPFVFHDASPFTPYTSYDISAPGHRARVAMPEGMLTIFLLVTRGGSTSQRPAYRLSSWLGL